MIQFKIFLLVVLIIEPNNNYREAQQVSLILHNIQNMNVNFRMI
jgi:hypothetical protein